MFFPFLRLPSRIHLNAIAPSASVSSSDSTRVDVDHRPRAILSTAVYPRENANKHREKRRLRPARSLDTRDTVVMANDALPRPMQTSRARGGTAGQDGEYEYTAARSPVERAKLVRIGELSSSRRSILSIAITTFTSATLVAGKPSGKRRGKPARVRAPRQRHDSDRGRVALIPTSGRSLVIEPTLATLVRAGYSLFRGQTARRERGVDAIRRRTARRGGR